MQEALGRAVCSPLGFHRRFQFGNAGFQRAGRIDVGPVEHDDGNTAILHEAVPGAGLVWTLLLHGARRSSQTKGTAHLRFGRYVIWGGCGFI